MSVEGKNGSRPRNKLNGQEALVLNAVTYGQTIGYTPYEGLVWIVPQAKNPPEDKARKTIVPRLEKKPRIEPTSRRAEVTRDLAGKEHNHRWLIDEADGPQSMGYCKHCGAEKPFNNWARESDFITSEEHRSAYTQM